MPSRSRTACEVDKTAMYAKAVCSKIQEWTIESSVIQSSCEPCPELQSALPLQICLWRRVAYQIYRPMVVVTNTTEFAPNSHGSAGKEHLIDISQPSTTPIHKH